MPSRTLLTLAVAGLFVFASGCDKLKSRDHINQGIAAYKNSKYPEAVEHFKQAIALDPTNANGRLYLATSYMTQWIPGADSEANNAFAAMAKEEFMKVLEKDPKDKTALASMASLAYNQAGPLPPDKKTEKFDEAAAWYRKLIDVDPKNKEAYYSLGVIAWGRWYPVLMIARANLRMKPEDPGPLPDKKVKEQLKTQYSSVIEEGIQELQKAIDIDNNYDDAMAYMNLMVRERADLLDDKDEYNKQVAIADGWMQKTVEARKAKVAAAEKAGASGITNDK